MAYSKQTWHDLPLVDTPITAARLGHIEDGVEAAANTADTNSSAITTTNANVAVNTTNIATNTANIATNTSAIATETSARTTAVSTEASARAAADALLLVKSSNLSDVASAATSRTNLGLGGAATLNVGTIAGTVAAGDDSRFTSLATPDAAAVGYDASTSTGYAEENGLIPEGVPILGPVAAADVQGAIDDLNRKTFTQDIAFYAISIRDAVRRIYPLVGAAPTTATGENIPGIAPLGASRTVPVANLATGTPNGSKFLRDDGTWAAPVAAATRTWQAEPGDQNLKAMVSDPNAFQNTATLLVASTCYALKVWLPIGTYTNYVVHCQTVGATLAANLYAFSLANADATGTLVTGSGTADAASVWTTTGVRTIALGTPFVNSTAGWFYILCQIGTGTTQPKVSTGAAHALANIGLAQSTNVAPNAATAPKWGTTTTGFSGLTPPAATGNIIEGGSTLVFFAGLS